MSQQPARATVTFPLKGHRGLKDSSRQLRPTGMATAPFPTTLLAVELVLTWDGTL